MSPGNVQELLQTLHSKLLLLLLRGPDVMPGIEAQDKSPIHFSISLVQYMTFLIKYYIQNKVSLFIHLSNLLKILVRKCLSIYFFYSYKSISYLFESITVE